MERLLKNVCSEKYDTHFVYSVKVKVVYREPFCRFVLVYNCKGWAVYGIIHSKLFAKGLYEGGFAGAHLAEKCKNVALKG